LGEELPFKLENENGSQRDTSSGINMPDIPSNMVSSSSVLDARFGRKQSSSALRTDRGQAGGGVDILRTTLPGYWHNTQTFVVKFQLIITQQLP